MAPELLLQQPHDRLVDWWALGVVCFEFVAGYRPFDAKSRDEVVKYAYRGISWSNFTGFTSEAKTFIDSLLSSDVQSRLTYQKGASEAKKHPFLADINFEKLEVTQMTP